MPRRPWLPADRFEPEAWLQALTGATVAGVVSSDFESYVRFDDLPHGEPLHVLARIMSEHTGTPERCWFLVWEGYSLNAAAIAGDPVFPLDDRRFYVFRGEVAELVDLAQYLATAGLDEETLARLNADGPSDLPSKWWPEDRAWVAGWHIDAAYLVVGCSDVMAERLLELKSLGARPASRVDPLEWG